MKKTLLYHSIGSQELASVISFTLDDLFKSSLVKTDGISYEATRLGKLIVEILCFLGRTAFEPRSLSIFRPAFSRPLRLTLNPMEIWSNFALF